MLLTHWPGRPAGNWIRGPHVPIDCRHVGQTLCIISYRIIYLFTPINFYGIKLTKFISKSKWDDIHFSLRLRKIVCFWQSYWLGAGEKNISQNKINKFCEILCFPILIHHTQIIPLFQEEVKKTVKVDMYIYIYIFIIDGAN